MDAVVLAGGYATRLWPITRHRPKMFLPIGEETVIDIIFAELEADSRIDHVFVSTNARFAPHFERFLADRPYRKPQLSVEQTTDEDEKFGVIGALAQLVDREGVADDLVVIAGDNLLSFAVGEFIDFFEATAGPVIAAYDVGEPAAARPYGVIELDGTVVTAFTEKPDHPESSLVSIACYGLPGATLDLLPEYLADGNNPDEPGWFIQWLQAARTVEAFTFDGAWFDIGTPASYLDAVAWYLDGESYCSPAATVTGSTLAPGSQVLGAATITDTTVEASVVFDGAEVIDSHITTSIVDEGARLRGLQLDGALIGAYSRIDG
jgi:glucose-1-phosphate thymidylyltransferase